MGGRGERILTLLLLGAQASLPAIALCTQDVCAPKAHARQNPAIHPVGLGVSDGRARRGRGRTRRVGGRDDLHRETRFRELAREAETRRSRFVKNFGHVGPDRFKAGDERRAIGRLTPRAHARLALLAPHGRNCSKSQSDHSTNR